MTLQSSFRRYALAALLVATVVAAGCKGAETLPETTTAPGAGESSASTGSASSGSGLQGGPLTEEQRRIEELLRQLVVYFDYDQAEILPEFNERLAAHGQRLAANPNMRIRLEGHADERGSREYNIGLGERRAQSVRRVLMLQGAGASQITTASYGEERPASTGSDEESWRLNRRVELSYP